MEIVTLVVVIGLGLALIVAEVYVVPGFNVLGAAGFLLIAFAVAYAFYEHGPASGLVAMGGATAALGATLYGLWHSGAWDRFVRADRRRPGPDERPGSEDRARYLGRQGVSLTPLPPAGIVEVDAERLEATTEGEFIAAGSRVHVVAMDRRRYFVRLADGEAPAAPAARQASAS